MSFAAESCIDGLFGFPEAIPAFAIASTSYVKGKCMSPGLWVMQKRKSHDSEHKKNPAGLRPEVHLVLYSQWPPQVLVANALRHTSGDPGLQFTLCVQYSNYWYIMWNVIALSSKVRPFAQVNASFNVGCPWLSVLGQFSNLSERLPVAF